MTRSKALLGAALVAAATLAAAQPSSYFLWKHKTTGATMCEPDADLKVWTKVSGPYEDSNCRILAKQ